MRQIFAHPMISALSFDPGHAPEFFTVTDHRISFRKSGESSNESATENLLQDTRDLLREFLQVPNTVSIHFQPFDSGLMNINEDKSAKAPHASLLNWTYHLPYYSITANEFCFSTRYGFGVPDGPSVFIGTLPEHPAAPANHSTLFLLNGVIRDMLRRGREIIRRETEYKSAVVDGMLDRHPILHPSATNSTARNKMLTAVNAGNHADRLAAHLDMAGIGYGRQHQTFFFANTPAHSKEGVEWLSDQLESFR